MIDDEISILQGLECLIQWEELGLEICAKCFDAVKALEVIHSTIPDIIITDIKMPEMSGLELVREVKLKYPNIKCIILSGYDDFELIKEAMLLGIENYLLKPVSKDELVSTLKNTIKKTESELNGMIVSRQGLNYLKDNILFRLVTGDIEKDEFEERASLLSLNIGKNYFIVAIISVIFEQQEQVQCKNNDKKLVRVSINNICEEILSGENLLAWTFFDLNGNIMVLFSGKGSIIDTTLIKNVLQNCMENINKYLRVNVFITVGSNEEHFDEIQTSYKNAKKLQEYQLTQPLNSIILYDDIMKSAKDSKKFLNVDFNKLQEYIISNDRDSAIKFIENIYSQLKNATGIDPDFIRNISLQTLFEIKLTFGKRILDPGLLLKEFKDTFLCTLKFNSCEKLKESLKEILNRAFELLDSYENEINPFIRKILEYIEDNYMKNINLKTIAIEQKVNPVYLGYLFKKETGIIFSNYLNSVRIEAAKKLLTDSRYKVCDVAFNVGYTSISYFNTIFKKVTGISPTDYKRSVS